MASDRPRFEDELRARVPWGVWRGITYFQIEEAEQDALADAVEAARAVVESHPGEVTNELRATLARLDGEQ